LLVLVASRSGAKDDIEAVSSVKDGHVSAETKRRPICIGGTAHLSLPFGIGFMSRPPGLAAYDDVQNLANVQPTWATRRCASDSMTVLGSAGN